MVFMMINVVIFYSNYEVIVIIIIGYVVIGRGNIILWFRYLRGVWILGVNFDIR